ncbi:MAG: hypothetical protein O2800_06475, partial [Planctomycetota bacterium]|nr:hypothetical protein [Planctomycetota bacterium]
PVKAKTPAKAAVKVRAKAATPVRAVMPVKAAVKPVSGAAQASAIAAVVPTVAVPAAAARRHTAWSWSPVAGAQSNMVDMVWAPSWRTPAEVAAECLSRPAGQRVIFFYANIVNEMARNANDRCQQWSANGLVNTNVLSPWLNNGIAETKATIQIFMTDFVAAGGLVDAIVIDNEKNLDAAYFMGNNGSNWSAVMQDPRFPALGQELGFTNLQQIQWGNDQWMTWNRVMGAKFDAAVQEAVYEVAKAKFPNVKFSNYDSFRVLESCTFPNISGYRTVRDSNGLGTHNSAAFYGRITNQMAHTRFDGVTEIGSTGFCALRNEVQAMRGIKDSSARPMQAWVANKSWIGDAGAATPLCNSMYWDEMVLQLGMHGVDTFMYWTEVSHAFNNADQSMNPAADQAIMNRLLGELDTMVGAGSGTAIYAAQPKFTDKTVATAMRVGSAIVWRFSFAEGVQSVKVTFTDGSTQVISREAGRAGAWFAHSADRQFSIGQDGSFPEVAVQAGA